MAVRLSNYDGDISSLSTDELGARQIGAFRGGLQFIGFENTTVTLTGSYLRDESNVPFYLLRDAARFPISGVVTEPDHVTTHADIGLAVEHEFDAFRFTSTTSFQRNRIESSSEGYDVLIPTYFPGSNIAYGRDTEETFSQEFRLNSLDGEDIRWVVGASVAYSYLDRDCRAQQCAPFPYYDSITAYSHLRSLNLGLFGDVSLPVAERWEVTLGGRLSHDDFEMKKSNSLGLASQTASGEADQTYLTGRAALSYQWSESAKTYASIARGHGTKIFELYSYPIGGVLPDAYPAATSWTYEIGTKVSLWNDRLELDGSLFYNDVKNGVIAFYDASVAGYRTTYQDYETSGFEIQARALVTEELSLTGGIGYTHTKLGSNGGNADVAGNRVPNIPEWSISAGLQYVLIFTEN